MSARNASASQPEAKFLKNGKAELGRKQGKAALFRRRECTDSVGTAAASAVLSARNARRRKNGKSAAREKYVKRTETTYPEEVRKHSFLCLCADARQKRRKKLR